MTEVEMIYMVRDGDDEILAICVHEMDADILAVAHADTGGKYELIPKEDIHEYL